MKQFITYLIIGTLCANIFGAAVGELLHALSHGLDSHAAHSHRHGHLHEEESHHHHNVITFMLQAFELQEASSTAPPLQQLSLLMATLEALIPDSHTALHSSSIKGENNYAKPLPLSSVAVETPSPPPKH
ncbi:hypothetical protein [Phaeodactylibacter luteus]|uniref:Uncharacterized protein n=1 Tax=Phaeodactylibacter luteus TaxID=1564516 RepID=A0A5C6RFT5_9BACT|nr:hypothetical protein [Phaeodactylibacter luteus]TXB60541.1 hypothetical protein FRY97_20590 [Phaeodactylibacter luteus]